MHPVAIETKEGLLADISSVTEPNGLYGKTLAEQGGFAKVGDIVSGLPTVEEIEAFVTENAGWREYYDNMPKYFEESKIPSFYLIHKVHDRLIGLSQHFDIKYPLFSYVKNGPYTTLYPHKDTMRLHRVRREFALDDTVKLPFDRLSIPIQDSVLGQQVSVVIPDDSSGVDKIYHLEVWKRGQISCTRTRYYTHWSCNASPKTWRYTILLTGLFTERTWEIINSKLQQRVVL